MVVALVGSNSSNQCLLLLSSTQALNSSSSKLWVWLNNSRCWGLLQGHRVWGPPQWVNLDSQGNLEARMVWVSSFPTS
jgi:hypothetical protein